MVKYGCKRENVRKEGHRKMMRSVKILIADENAEVRKTCRDYIVKRGLGSVSEAATVDLLPR